MDLYNPDDHRHLDLLPHHFGHPTHHPCDVFYMKEYNLRPRPSQKPIEKPASPVKRPQLEDDSMMPFGKHGPKGPKPLKMKEVPAKYFWWLWTEGDKEHDMTCPVADYIRRNLRSLAGEYTDGIW